MQPSADTLAQDKTLLRKKLEQLAEAPLGGKEIADEVAGTSEETAELFSSRYRPALRRATDEGGDEPDGVNLRFAPR